MISTFNRRQVIKGILSLCLSGAATILAWLFFKIACSMVNSGFRLGYSTATINLVATVLTALVYLGGWLQWRSGEGHRSFAESSLNMQIEPATGGAHAVEQPLQPYTGAAYVLSQIFLAAPLQLFEGLHRFNTMIPKSDTLEENLLSMLEEIRAKKVWHPAATYAGRGQELSYLARMEAIEFSAYKGTVRTKQTWLQDGAS